MPFIHKASNDLLRAEALIRHSNPEKRDYSLVAQLIYQTRVNNGNLQALTGEEDEQTLLDAIYYEWMIEVGPQGLGPESWFTNRRFGKLQEGTMIHLPVPAQVLEAANLPVYTFGGTNSQQPTFSIRNPLNNANGVPLKPTFVWTSIPGETSYSILIGELLTGSTFLTIGSISDTTFTMSEFTLKNFTFYTLFVTPSQSNTTLSTTFRTVDFPMGSPLLLSPAQESEVFASSVNFMANMQPGESKLTSYAYGNELQISTNPEFTMLVHDSTYTFPDIVLPQSEFIARITHLSPGQTYYWRVRTINQGGASNWSEVRRFKTKSTAAGNGVLQLQSPVASQEQVSIPTRFIWTHATDAKSYDLQVSDQADFTSFMQYSALIDTAFIVPDLAGKTRHFWRVRAITDSELGSWTQPEVFTTGVPVPNAPEWSPNGGAEIDGASIAFKWASNDYATSYAIQVSSSEEFTSLEMEESGLPSTHFVWNSAPIGQYFWRVAASNESGTSAWSEVLTFTVVTTSTGSEQLDGLPTEFSLEQNFPNPFNPTTTFEFGLPVQSQVELSVFNMLGQKVATIFNGSKSAGVHTVSFDASALSSGVYVYQLRAGSFVENRAFTLLK